MKKKFLVIMMATLMSLSAAACSSESTTDEPDTQSNEVVVTDDTTTSDDEITVSDYLTCPEFTAEQNTSEMVDQIAQVAKDNASEMTDEEATEIINAIRKADHNFYNGPEEMEKYMWYGYLLDYKYDDSDPRSSLGTDLCQAIKYVYRGAESVLDDATHENLLQIDKDLEEIQ